MHRVGRTARAGATGRSISLISDSTTDRSLLRDIAKHTKKDHSVKNRTIPPDVIASFRTRLEGLEDDIQDVLAQEEEERYV